MRHCWKGCRKSWKSKTCRRLKPTPKNERRRRGPEGPLYPNSKRSVGRCVPASLLYFAGAVRQNNCLSAIRAPARNSVKFRGWLLMLLFVHVLLHPLVHAIGTSGAASDLARVSASSTPPDSSLTTGDQCELCRVGHNTIVTPALPQADLMNPRWIRVALQAVNYSSLQAGDRIPSRAPPSL
jgi:hypothetical protein